MELVLRACARFELFSLQLEFGVLSRVSILAL